MNLLTMKLCCLQHFEPEEAGLIAVWAAERGHELRTVRLYLGEPLPQLEPDEALVLMGGPMNVDEDDKYAWLAGEKQLIAAHAKSGGRVFGVCLGGQLIARAFDAPVTRNRHKEIGWWKVQFSPEALASGPFEAFPPEMTVLQWHGDTFAIPQGAVHLASSPVCQSQAFSICNGRVIGLQFHFEAEEQEVRDFVSFFDDELVQSGPYVQSAEEILVGLEQNAGPCREALFKVLDRWERS